MDQVTVFNGKEMKEHVCEFGFEIINSTPYYAQANEKDESMNKIIKNNIRKII